MPKLSSSVPKYRKHRASGQAVVTLSGQDHYLGPHGTKASRLEYDRLVMEWLAAGRPAHPVGDEHVTTVKELVLDFWKFARKHYRKDGKATGTAENYKPALSLLRTYYGRKPAVEFGPKALKALRLKMIETGNSRRYVNDNVDRIKRVFKWGASEQMFPAAVHQSLQTVESLPKGRTDARESDPVEPVADKVVDATLPHMPPIVADMVRFQRLTGARPTEVCILRPCDVERDGDVWRYVPESHKTEHHGKGRVIFIGPRAQDVLRSYLLRDESAYCFQPKESERKRSAKRREDRRSPMTPSQAARKRKRNPERAPSNRYNKDSYRKAVQRACEFAFPPPRALAQHKGESAKKWAARLSEKQTGQLKAWQSSHRWAPNQLRHTAGTEIRREFGLEGAQVVLGHSKMNTTEIYAEKNLRKAEEIARQVG